MLNCPYCHQPMSDDPANPGKILCYNCRKRYDTNQVIEYWQAKANITSTTTPQQNISRLEQQPSMNYVPPMDSTQDKSTSITAQPRQKKPSKIMAIIAFIFAIIALLSCWLPLINVVSIVIGMISIILGIVVYRRSKKGHCSGKRLGITGIVMSIISIGVSIAITLPLIIVLSSIDDDIGDKYEDYDSYMNDITSELESRGIMNIYNGNTPWTKLEFSVNNKTYRLMESTLKDLEESRYVLDLVAQGYPDGYSVEPQQMISIIELECETETPYEEYFIVNVANLGEEPIDIKDCVLTKFEYHNEGTESNISINGVSCGTTTEEIEKVFGKPQDIETFPQYMLYQYETEKYTKYFHVTFVDNITTGFALSSMEY